MTVKGKYENPVALVSLDCLDNAFKLAKSGCNVLGCLKPFVSHSVRVDGSGAKVTFVCKKGHPMNWTSCEQLGRQTILVNRLVPAAAIMTGLKLTPMRRFLGLLRVDSYGADYMKTSSLNQLIKLTEQLYEEDMNLVRADMLTKKTFELGMRPI